MQAWQVIVGVYFVYLAVLCFFVETRPGVWRCTPVAVCLALPALALPGTQHGHAQVGLAIVVPAAFLIAGYWLSGLFFTGPMKSVERVLLQWDRWPLPRLGLAWLAARGPRWVLEGLELSYLLVNPVVPGGAFVLAPAGRLRLVALIEQRAVIGRVLEHLGVPTERPAPRDSAPGPGAARRSRLPGPSDPGRLCCRTAERAGFVRSSELVARTPHAECASV